MYIIKAEKLQTKALYSRKFEKQTGVDLSERSTADFPSESVLVFYDRLHKQEKKAVSTVEIRMHKKYKVFSEADI